MKPKKAPLIFIFPLFSLQLCTKNSYDGLVHFRKPFIFTSEILFGDYNNLSTNCSNDESKINISLSIGSPNTATEKYEMINVKNVDECTKEILKFSPIPDLHECKFDKVLSINDIHLKMDFEKVQIDLKCVSCD